MSENIGLPAEGETQQARPVSESDLVALLSQKVVGQAAVMKLIVPYIHMWQAGLAPEGRPAGVFLLLGPTRTGKNKTVETLARVVHGSPKNIGKKDCGEIQKEQEGLKLIGAPPGDLAIRRAH